VILALDRTSHVPLYAQIAAQLRDMMGTGALRIGDRLPPNRELARTLGVNRNTVTTAYAELVADGLVSSQVGSGTYISALPSAARSMAASNTTQASPMPWDALLTNQTRDGWLHAMDASKQPSDVISLGYALPQAELFPLDDFRKCVDRVLRKQGRVLLQLGASRGYEPLQEYIASQMRVSGMSVKPDEILITNGCQQSLDLIRQILVGPGDEVALENPTYPGTLSIFCGHNSKFISVPVGAKGIDLDVLEDVMAQRRPKLIYTIPSFHNPTGVTMDLAARRRLIGLAIKYRVPIVEDDIYRELRYDGPSLPSLKALDEHGLVVYVNSFSKVGFPGLRVGWIAAPRIVIEHLDRAKQRCDLHASLLAQAAIHEFSKHGLLARHIKRVRRAYAERRDTMLEALGRYFPEEAAWNKPEGGMAIWVRLPESVNANQLLLQASESGVVFIPGDHFYSSAPQTNRLRLSFTMADPPSIEEAVKRLGGLIKGRLSKMKKQHRFSRAEGFRALV
jgi:2-aminoadipate transaminase